MFVARNKARGGKEPVAVGVAGRSKATPTHQRRASLGSTASSVDSGMDAQRPSRVSSAGKKLDSTGGRDGIGNGTVVLAC